MTAGHDGLDGGRNELTRGRDRAFAQIAALATDVEQYASRYLEANYSEAQARRIASNQLGSLPVPDASPAEQRKIAMLVDALITATTAWKQATAEHPAGGPWGSLPRIVDADRQYGCPSIRAI